MKYLLSFSFAIMLSLFSCTDKDQTKPCPPCHSFSDCLDGRCVCSHAGSVYINEDWCVPPDSYLASFDDWYCMDTVAIGIGAPVTINPGTPGTISVSNKRLSKARSGFQQGIAYYPMSSGDSFVVRNIPMSMINDQEGCKVAGGVCEVDMFAKFRKNSKDTIDASLRMRCTPKSAAEHNAEKKIMFVKFN